MKKKEEKDIKKLEEENVDEIKNQLEYFKKLSEERLSQIKYLHADFENLRKKFEKEKTEIINLANEGIIKELIIILDDFDAAIKLSNEENREGLIKIKNKFFDILANKGLKEIEAIGKKFNPEFHEVLCKELSKHNEDEIIEEIQKGYCLNSRVIRYSKVKVSKKDDQQNLKSDEIKQ